MPRIELEDERGRYEAVIPEEPDTRKLRILRDWLDLGIRDYEPTSDRCDECENEEGGAMRYRKKPLEIEAWRYGEEATPEWGHVAFESGVLRLTPDGEAKVRTLEGSMTARKGDYIVKGIKGELYPVKPDIFDAPVGRLEDVGLHGSVDAQKDWRAAVTEANDLLNDVIGLEAAGDMEVPEYPFARILCAADELGSVEDWMTTETDDE